MGRRRRSYLVREWRKARRGMRPNRIAARFISGGKHQTLGAIVSSPFRTKTITTRKTRRTQYQAHRKRERQAAQKQRRRQQREAARQAAAARKAAAAARKNAPKTPRKRTPRPPIAVNARTGKPITLAQAMRAVKEASDRAERLAAGLPADPPAPQRRARAPKAAPKTTPPRLQRRRSTGTSTRKTATKKTTQRGPRRRIGPAPDPTAAPGKNLRGLYLAATCPCQGTGRIAVLTTDGRATGSTSCPQHGRAARGSRKLLSRRAMTDSGLPGMAAWLSAKTKKGRGNLDAKQRRAARQSHRTRHAGPTAPCRACDEGIVNRPLTDKLRAELIRRILADCAASGDRAPSGRKLKAMARKAYPYDLCRQCRGLGRVPSKHAGAWYDRTNLREQHPPTARERATGRRPPRA